MPVPTVAAVVLALATAGCGSSTTADTTVASTTARSAAAVTGRITVSAAASLTAPFREIGAAFEAANPGAEVEFNFDASGTLAKQIQEGAPADVFASADEANMDGLVDAGLVAATPRVFARNELTIVVKKGNPTRIDDLADLAAAGTVSLCGSEVPCGRYADRVLSTAGVTIPTDKITRGQNVKATLGAVADGDADAGIVYVTDVTGDEVEAVPIPEGENMIATYPIATLTSSQDPETAEAFVSHVLGADSQAVLRAAGFLPPT